MPHMANLPWTFYYASIPLMIVYLKFFKFFNPLPPFNFKQSWTNKTMPWKW
uniref:ATP synthase F0 subunit 8 n=1 Tax=Pseudobiotus spinifer TaxID=1477120 RepID=A0A0K0KA06_9BILA|nr:ATP synthase F0 subunit 8 [Pseudobiotus spinifer]